MTRKNLLFFGLSLFYLNAYQARLLDVEDDLFPIQPSLVYNQSLDTLNPFEISSSNISAIKENALISGKDLLRSIGMKSPLSINNKQWRVDFPYDKDRLSVGWELNRLVVNNLSLVVYGLSINQISITEILGNIKIKKFLHPSFKRLMYFANGKLGLSQADYDITAACFGVGIGADYYYNEWVGAHCEWGIKYRHILKSAYTLPTNGLVTTHFSIGIKSIF